MKNTRKMLSMLVGILLTMSFFVGMASADGYADATITWVVPGDDTITVSYPAETTEVKFTTTGQDFMNSPADSQTGAVSALRVQNDGNQNLQVNATWTAEWIDGVEGVNVSIGDNTNATLVYWTDDNETTANHTFVASLPPDGSDTEDFWMWTNGTAVGETTGTSRTMRLWSKGV